MLIKRIVSFVIFLLLLIGIGFYVKGHVSEFQDMRRLSPQYILILTFFTLMYFVSQGLILRTILSPFGITLKVKEWFGITLVTLLGNTFIPFGGLGFRAGYLKKIHRFDYTHFLTTLAAIYIIEFFIFTLGGLVSLCFLFFNDRIVNVGLTIFLSGILLACGIVLFFPFKLSLSKRKIVQRIKSIIDSWQGIRTNHALLKKIVILTLLEFLLVSSIFYFSFRAFGFHVPFLGTFLPSCLSDFAFFIRIMPASFGFYEGAVVYAARFLGLTIAQGLLVVAIIRVISLFLILTLGFLFSHILIKQRPREVRVSANDN